MSIKKNNFADKVKGALYGFAIGDAMGATTEFMSEKEINKSFGRITDIIGGGWLGLYGGQVTDDTQMSLCVMDALTSDDFTNCVKDNFIHWYESEPIDIGNQCSKGIRYLILGKHIGVEPNALGNGALMRALPCALYGSLGKNIYQGMLTHNNHINRNCIGTYHEEIQGYLHDKSFKHKQYIISEQLVEPTGYVINTLNNALVWVAKTDNLEDCIIGPVNHGGDADTIAAITGGLAGAKYGFEQIPQRWIEQLNAAIKEQLDTFTQFIISNHQEPDKGILS